MSKFLRCLSALVLVFGAFEARAQMFEEDVSKPSSRQVAPSTLANPRRTMTSPRAVPAAKTPSASASQGAAVSATESKKSAVATKVPAKDDGVVELINDPDTQFFLPPPEVSPVDRPTLDGVQRGRAVVTPVLASGDLSKAVEDELIFLYYKDFKMDRMMGGMVTCNVTFVVLTNLNRTLNNISVKLQWPEMTTSLSMDNVAPSTETIMTYKLLGNGCYSMDKVPNVIVNRCRIKGLSQQQCADRIRWIRR